MIHIFSFLNRSRISIAVLRCGAGSGQCWLAAALDLVMKDLERGEEEAGAAGEELQDLRTHKMKQVKRILILFFLFYKSKP